MKGTLIIFVKAPVAGRVKTRLAASIGAGRAAAIYRRLTANTIAAARKGPWRTVLAVDPAPAAKGRSTFWPAALSRTPQGRGDLGKRMRRLIDAAPKGPVVIIGSDAPTLRAHHIRRAFKALQGADAAFGPAPDGGFWLIGFSRRRGRAPSFAGVRWSGERALADTLRALPHSFSVATLERLGDIDDARDLESAGRCALMRAISFH